MEIRYCCPDKYQFGDCEGQEFSGCYVLVWTVPLVHGGQSAKLHEGDGYEWTEYFNSDDATQDGDWELIKSFSPSDVCQNPIAVQGWVSNKEFMFGITVLRTALRYGKSNFDRLIKSL